MARNINAVFEISEDSTLCGVSFRIIDGDKATKLNWDEMTRKEQVKMLNAWVKFWQLFYDHIKEEE